MHDVKWQLLCEIQACESRPFTLCTPGKPRVVPFPSDLQLHGVRTTLIQYRGNTLQVSKQRTARLGLEVVVKPVLLQKVRTALHEEGTTYTQLALSKNTFNS